MWPTLQSTATDPTSYLIEYGLIGVALLVVLTAWLKGIVISRARHLEALQTQKEKYDELLAEARKHYDDMLAAERDHHAALLVEIRNHNAEVVEDRDMWRATAYTGTQIAETAVSKKPAPPRQRGT